MKYLSKEKLRGKKIDVHTHSTGIVLEHLLKQRYPIVQDLYDLSNMIEAGGIDYAITFPMPLSVYYDSRSYWDNKKLVSSSLSDFPFQVIIPGFFEPLVRTLRATIPKNESHLFR